VDHCPLCLTSRTDYRCHCGPQRWRSCPEVGTGDWEVTPTRLPSNLRQTTRECVYLVSRGHCRSCDKGDESHRSIRHSRKLHAAHKLDGSVFWHLNRVYCRVLYIAGIGNLAFFASVSLTLTRWPSCTNLTHQDVPYILMLMGQVRTWRSSWYVPVNQKWTYCVKAFISYRITDIRRPTDRPATCY